MQCTKGTSLIRACSKTKNPSPIYVNVRKLAASCEYGELMDEFYKRQVSHRFKESRRESQVAERREAGLAPIKRSKCARRVKSPRGKWRTFKAPKTSRRKKLKSLMKERKRRKLVRRKKKNHVDRRRITTRRRNVNSEPKCRYCGRKQRHVSRTEHPAFGQTCSKCQKKGHFASVGISSKKVH